MENKSVFNILNAIDVSKKIEKKNGLSYLSWAWAWAEVKKLYPNANYTIYERETEYGAVNYFTDGKTCWVKTGVTIEGLEHIEELPVMDFRNKSITLSAVTSFDVNKTIQRSLTKALARHGLGLYIYAGEDLPEDDTKGEPRQTKTKVKDSGATERQKKIAVIIDFTSAHPTFKKVMENYAQKNGAKSLVAFPDSDIEEIYNMVLTGANSYA